ncbi:MAG: hypothetical protein ACM31L_11575 [Actinomycetota bacterium]
MARDGNEDKVRLLRLLAFHVHKKIPPAEALATCFEAEGRGGRHRQWRQGTQVLDADGFVPALLATNLVGPEGGAVLAVVESGGDHRLMSAALTALAELAEQGER